MNLVMHRGQFPNFGDDLNEYIFKSLFPDFDRINPEIDFYGIGSILDSRVNNPETSVVFGTGIRGLANLDARSFKKIYFVRGPVTARLLGEPESSLIDSAYLLKLVNPSIEILSEKKFQLGLMPYYLHMDKFNWKILELLGSVKIIDPRNSVEQVLHETCSCEHIISGAMHGAILADIMRIPWARLSFGRHGYESSMISEMKWLDWTGSIELDSIVKINISRNRYKVCNPIEWSELIYQVMRKCQYNLSDSKLLDSRYSRLHEKCSEFSTDYHIQKV